MMRPSSGATRASSAPICLQSSCERPGADRRACALRPSPGGGDGDAARVRAYAEVPYLTPGAGARPRRGRAFDQGQKTAMRRAAALDRNERRELGLGRAAARLAPGDCGAHATELGRATNGLVHAGKLPQGGRPGRAAAAAAARGPPAQHCGYEPPVVIVVLVEQKLVDNPHSPRGERVRKRLDPPGLRRKEPSRRGACRCASAVMSNPCRKHAVWILLTLPPPAGISRGTWHARNAILGLPRCRPIAA